MVAVSTDVKGGYSVRLQPGVYDVFVSEPSFSPIARKIRVDEGKELIVDFELRLDPLAQLVSGERAECRQRLGE